MTPVPRPPTQVPRRTLLRSLAALPLAGGIAGCAGTSGPAFVPDGGRATIGYGVWDADQVPAMQEVIAAFHAEHPDVDVAIQLTPWATYWTKLQTSIVGGGAADVFWMNAPNIARYARYDTLLPLSDRLRRDGVTLTEHPKNLVELYQHEGEQFGIPKDFDTISLYYNTELFDRAGISYPDESWTWQHVLDASAEIRDPASGVFGFSAALDRQRNLYPAIFQNRGWVLRGTRSGFDDDATIGGLRHLTDAIDRGLAPNAMVEADTRPRELFQGGKVAMYNGLPNDSNATYEDPEVRARTGIAVLPRGVQRGNVIHGLANVVNARTAYPDAAYEFVKFMAGRTAGEIQGRSGTILPSFSGTQQAFLDSKPEFRMQSFIDQVPDATAYPASVNTMTWELMQLRHLGPSWIGAGSRPVEQSARSLADDMNGVLAKEAV
ncbi:ABC transporter substrate-binding protein [Pseudonocardia kunmingensis]|uniref:Carbohydrate ABC transporter substrate-binding protein (CUT1 family) n=1 Tax=Pseudonocardia kunmingensis TaxID=630975 RepID=A0A543DYX4_9PSEU|nr:sugar ABC transporter substrate-binding protein [Pseudonocardia kunmingensis]TQM14542.1 carbohydrate ABC transporter substrate-binding protein (CUT1 family) [Pseudonocardia kunmingensis]